MSGHRRLLCAALIAAQTHSFVPEPPKVAALHLKETLNKKGFVRVPGDSASKNKNDTLLLFAEGRWRGCRPDV